MSLVFNIGLLERRLVKEMRKGDGRFLKLRIIFFLHFAQLKRYTEREKAQKLKNRQREREREKEREREREREIEGERELEMKKGLELNYM